MRDDMLEVATVLIAMAVSGCFAPTYKHTMCGPGNACPDGLVCTVQSGPPGTCEPPGSGVNVGVDASVDAPSDAMPGGKCPSGYAAVAGSAHLYKALSD